MITEEDKDKLIATLTLQLQDKEKEISVLKSQLCLCQISQSIDQDKISFALEQLEKVKEFVKENESWEIEGSDYSIVYADDVLDHIDNQIDELKKEMK